MVVFIGTTARGLFKQLHNGCRGVLIFNAVKIFTKTLTSTTENKQLVPAKRVRQTKQTAPAWTAA